MAVILSIVKGHAQTSVYHPFPDSNAVWREWRSGWNSGINGEVWNYEETLAGDTLIGGLTYKKILETGATLMNSNPWTYYYNTYKGGIRQDTSQRKVFFILPTSSTETTLYDFNLSVGDTIHSYNYPWGIVSSVDSILIGSNYRKIFRGTKGVDFIEGIGSTWGLLHQVLSYLNHQNEFYCFTQNGQTIYHPDTTQSCAVPTGIGELYKNILFAIFPNPTSGIFTLSSSEKISTVEISDVLGKQVYEKQVRSPKEEIDLSSQPKGIYFLKAQDENGNFGVRKVIVQ